MMCLRRACFLVNLVALAAMIAPSSTSAQTLAENSSLSPGYAPLEAPYLTPQIPVTPDAIAPNDFQATIDAMGDRTFVLQNIVLENNRLNSPNTAKAIANPYEVPGQGNSEAQSLGESSSLSPQFAQSPESHESYSIERRRYENAQYRAGFSYVGLGATLGWSGESSLGEAGATIISRVAFADSFSVRPSLIIGDGTTITIPFTYDWSISREPYSAPITIFAGGGFGFDLKSGNHGPLLATGIDIPFSHNLTFNATVNAAFFEVSDRDWGLTLGVGYNFPGLLFR